MFIGFDNFANILNGLFDMNYVAIGLCNEIPKMNVVQVKGQIYFIAF